jgi:hypothetical protein
VREAIVDLHTIVGGQALPRYVQYPAGPPSATSARKVGGAGFLPHQNLPLMLKTEDRQRCTRRRPVSTGNFSLPSRQEAPPSGDARSGRVILARRPSARW